jgi:hypothetical protein
VCEYFLVQKYDEKKKLFDETVKEMFHSNLLTIEEVKLEIQKKNGYFRLACLDQDFRWGGIGKWIQTHILDSKHVKNLENQPSFGHYSKPSNHVFLLL